MSEFELAAQPHDAFFKQTFSDPVRAAAFFQQHLPAALVEQIRWNSLTLLPGSFVRRDLQQSHSDLLFSAQAGIRDVRLFLLFEHQTTVDVRMPLRMLRYILEILWDHDEQHGLPLPPVLGFVLHQGPDRWTVSQQFQDLFDLPAELKELLEPYLPSFTHALLDLTQCDPQSDEFHAQVRAALELMKRVREKNLLPWLNWLAQWQQALEQISDEFFLQLLGYAVQVDNVLDVEALAHTFRENPPLRESAMSLAEKLIKQGREEGREEGRLKGIWIGKIQSVQDLMNLPVTPSAVLEEQDLPELARQHESLKQACRVMFSGGD